MNDSEKINELRDKMAIAAMNAICTNAGRNGYVFSIPEEISNTAYKIADAMLLERSKGIKGETSINVSLDGVHKSLHHRVVRVTDEDLNSI